MDPELARKKYADLREKLPMNDAIPAFAKWIEEQKVVADKKALLALLCKKAGCDEEKFLRKSYLFPKCYQAGAADTYKFIFKKDLADGAYNINPYES